MDTTPQSQRQQLRSLLDPWTATLEVRSIETARSYRLCAIRFIDGLDVDGVVDTDAASRYLRSLEGLAPASRAHHVSAVKAFLRFARDRGVVARSIDSMLVRPRVTVTSFGRYLELDELRTLLVSAEELSPRHLGTVMGLALTGLRVSELAGARCPLCL